MSFPVGLKLIFLGSFLAVLTTVNAPVHAADKDLLDLLDSLPAVKEEPDDLVGCDLPAKLLGIRAEALPDSRRALIKAEVQRILKQDIGLEDDIEHFLGLLDRVGPDPALDDVVLDLLRTPQGRGELSRIVVDLYGMSSGAALEELKGFIHNSAKLTRSPDLPLALGWDGLLREPELQAALAIQLNRRFKALGWVPGNMLFLIQELGRFKDETLLRQLIYQLEREWPPEEGMRVLRMLMDMAGKGAEPNHLRELVLMELNVPAGFRRAELAVGNGRDVSKPEVVEAALKLVTLPFPETAFFVRQPVARSRLEAIGVLARTPSRDPRVDRALSSIVKGEVSVPGSRADRAYGMAMAEVALMRRGTERIPSMKRLAFLMANSPVRAFWLFSTLPGWNPIAFNEVFISAGKSMEMGLFDDVARDLFLGTPQQPRNTEAAMAFLKLVKHSHPQGTRNLELRIRGLIATEPPGPLQDEAKKALQVMLSP